MRDPDQGYPIRQEPDKSRKTALSVRCELPAKPEIVNQAADYQIPARMWSNWTPANGPREIRREMTTVERRIVAHRAMELTGALRPFMQDQRNAVDVALSRMIGGFQRHLEVGSIVEVLLDVLREFPAWAIVEGCLRLTKDQHSLNPPFNPNFGPSDNQIYQVVAAVALPYQRRLAQAEALLSAPVEKPAEDSRPKETWAQTKAYLEAHGFTFGKDKQPIDTPEQVMSKFGLSKEAWDAIPNLPADFEDRAKEKIRR